MGLRRSSVPHEPTTSDGTLSSSTLPVLPTWPDSDRNGAGIDPTHLRRRALVIRREHERQTEASAFRTWGLKSGLGDRLTWMQDWTRSGSEARRLKAKAWTPKGPTPPPPDTRNMRNPWADRHGSGCGPRTEHAHTMASGDAGLVRSRTSQDDHALRYTIETPTLFPVGTEEGRKDECREPSAVVPSLVQSPSRRVGTSRIAVDGCRGPRRTVDVRSAGVPVRKYRCQYPGAQKCAQHVAISAG
jgi:hypothetical protein